MSIKIERKIVGYDIAKPAAEGVAERDPKPQAAYQTAPGWDTQKSDLNGPDPTNPNTPREAADSSSKIVRMHEKVERPEMLVGSTYKIKTPVTEHAFYVTINDMVLNPGTPYEKRRPFEMFINSKNMGHYQWISALTLIISAVFRKGGDINFLVEELRSVFDPKGGYFRRGGKYMPSLVAEIGTAIESHLKMIGLMATPTLDEHQQQLVDQKRQKYEQQQAAIQADPVDHEAGAFPESAELCSKCHTKAMIIMDNCLTCLNCGESKCG